MSDASKPIVRAPECVTDDHTFVPAYDWRLDPEVGYEGDPTLRVCECVTTTSICGAGAR